MTCSKLLARHGKLIATTLGSLLVSLPMIPFPASAAPVVPRPMQRSGMARTQVIPSTGFESVLPLSQIRVATALPYPLNPCPSIYYEYPYNQRVVVPKTCQPNKITARLDSLGLRPMAGHRAAATRYNAYQSQTRQWVR
ncbi:MAG: hypothetical protein JOZ78_08050 [Chroococcidiopsidaceae cyanobacterium CP_BM_ER_R8_30]|nr:hypothetical protein [Chroococcidiopsidaceae cyanobacterium CP_BM_ER_R8_30]